MEEDVLRAMARWPNVPEVEGWLCLDRRGDWWLRGQRVRHPNSLRFIAANYASDDSGRFFFQNGPQRAYVDLEITPWIIRVTGETLRTHTNLEVEHIKSVLLDEESNLYFDTEHGPGIVHDQDLSLLLDYFTSCAHEDEASYFQWKGSLHHIEHIEACQLVQRFQYNPQPRLQR